MLLMIQWSLYRGAFGYGAPASVRIQPKLPYGDLFCQYIYMEYVTLKSILCIKRGICLLGDNFGNSACLHFYLIENGLYHFRGQWALLYGLRPNVCNMLRLV